MKIKIELIKVLLWACIEDYAGLWELHWEVSSKFPDLSEEERERILIEALSLLISNGLVKLYRCDEPYGDLSELGLEAALSALSEEKNWEAPDTSDVSIRASATKSGEELYEKGDYDSIR